MDLSTPFQSMFPVVDSAALDVLTRSTKPRTGREVAKLAGRSQDATQRLLDRLVDHGLVLRRDAGRARVYELNWDHVAAEPISQLADLRARLFQRLRESFEFWDPAPFHVSVFGSAARGDGDLNSDIDIFLVRPGGVAEDDEGWRRQVEALADSAFEWTGNHAGIAEVGHDELKRLRQERPAIVKSINADAVVMAGVPVRSVLKGI
jgi:hypothetical protein